MNNRDFEFGLTDGIVFVKTRLENASRLSKHECFEQSTLEAERIAQVFETETDDFWSKIDREDHKPNFTSQNYLCGFYYGVTEELLARAILEEMYSRYAGERTDQGLDFTLDDHLHQAKKCMKLDMSMERHAAALGVPVYYARRLRESVRREPDGD